MPDYSKIDDMNIEKNLSKMPSTEIYKDDISELESVMIDKDTGYIKSVSFEALVAAGITLNQCRWFMHVYGLYTFPTTELIDWLKSQVDIDSCIEICAGVGWIGRELDIISTDSFMQADATVRKHYEANGVIPIIYPDDVEKFDAHDAIRHYQPDYVIGSYVTTKYGCSGKGYGNAFGVDNAWVANHCKKYIMIGNDNIHKKDAVMKRKHETYRFPWLITRGDISKAAIYVWENKQWK